MYKKIYILLVTFIATGLFAQELEKVKVQLKWKHQFQFAGFYMAKEKGFYKELGLEVELQEYNGKDNIVDNVLSEKSDYGFGYPSVILEKTKNKDIVLINAYLESSPHVLMSLKSSGIKTIKDFKGKKIMISQAASYTVSFISMLHANNINISDMQPFDPSFAIESLIDKKIDIITAFRTNELYQLKKRAIAYDIWDPKDYGFDFYDDILFTSKQELQENPQRVEKFKKATLKGFKYAYENIEETVNVILQKYNTQDKTEGALLYEAYALKKLAFENNKQLGSIDCAKIQRIIDIYNVFGHIEQKIDMDDFIYKPDNGFFLSEKQKSYLAQKKIVKMCIDPNWMPFEELSQGKYRGMSADYFKLLQEKLPVNFEVVQTKNWDESIDFAKQGKCDILSLAMSTPEREKYFKFTDPYLKIPLVMATRIDAPFVTEFESLENKKVAMSKGYAFIELLRAQYPNLEIIEVENLNDGLQKVVNAEMYGYIGTLATIGYAFMQDFTGELKIAGKFDGTWNLGIAVKSENEVLYEILQKAVNSVDERQRSKIMNEWLSIKYESSIDYALLFKTIAGFSLLLVLMVIFYLRERNLKKDIEINQNLLEAIIDKIPNPLFYKDQSGVFKNVNSAFCKNILSLTKKEVLEKNFYDIENLNSLVSMRLTKEDDIKFFKGQSSQEYESEVETHDGTIKSYKITKTVFRSESGEELGYIGIMSDITELKNKEKRLQELASVDPLTKLYNRRYFTKMASQLLSLAKRDNESISLIMMDIDNFKKVNDTYGHKIGDNVIVCIADILQSINRDSDIAARFGGEEFLMLLPKTDIDGAAVIAEKIREKVQSTAVVANEQEKIHVTISLGISELDVSKENDIEAAIQRADEALYIAKRSGKNRVCRV